MAFLSNIMYSQSQFKISQTLPQAHTTHKLALSVSPAPPSVSVHVTHSLVIEGLLEQEVGC